MLVQDARETDRRRPSFRRHDPKVENLHLFAWSKEVQGVVIIDGKLSARGSARTVSPIKAPARWIHK